MSAQRYLQLARARVQPAAIAGVLDPRPDLVDDSANWDLLLAFAQQQDGDAPEGVYGALLAFRCQGTRLEVADGRARLLPPTGDDFDPLYGYYRDKYLVPHLADLTELLHRLEKAAAVLT